MKLIELIQHGEDWLAGQGCGIVINRSIRAAPDNGEIPDVIGWKPLFSILVKCISAIDDFIGDSLMRYRLHPLLSMGDLRFFCPPDVQIPECWGLIYAHEDGLEIVCGIPENSDGWISPTFLANKIFEA